MEYIFQFWTVSAVLLCNYMSPTSVFKKTKNGNSHLTPGIAMFTKHSWCRRKGLRGEKIVLTNNPLVILLLFSFYVFCCRCQIIDFHKPTGAMGTHPRLFEWVLHYYSTDNEGGAKVVCTSKPPIYLQHQGQYHNIPVSYSSLSFFICTAIQSSILHSFI